MIWDIKNIQTPSGFHGKGYQWMRAPVWPLWPCSKPVLGSFPLSSRPFPPETVGRELTRGMLRKTKAWPLMQLLVVSWCLLLVVLSSRKISTYQLQTKKHHGPTGFVHPGTLPLTWLVPFSCFTFVRSCHAALISSKQKLVSLDSPFGESGGSSLTLIGMGGSASEIAWSGSGSPETGATPSAIGIGVGDGGCCVGGASLGGGRGTKSKTFGLAT